MFEGPLALLTVEEIYEQASIDLFQKLKEDRRVERKPSGIHSNFLGEYFSMWSNTAPDGGLMVIGMENDGAKTTVRRMCPSCGRGYDFPRNKRCPACEQKRLQQEVDKKRGKQIRA